MVPLEILSLVFSNWQIQLLDTSGPDANKRLNQFTFTCDYCSRRVGAWTLFPSDPVGKSPTAQFDLFESHKWYCLWHNHENRYKLMKRICPRVSFASGDAGPGVEDPSPSKFLTHEKDKVTARERMRRIRKLIATTSNPIKQYEVKEVAMRRNWEAKRRDLMHASKDPS
jgi:hypothetical protein